MAELLCRESPPICLCLFCRPRYRRPPRGALVSLGAVGPCARGSLERHVPRVLPADVARLTLDVR